MARSSHNGVIIGSLKVSTENLGDYIQILASLRLLKEMQLRPGIYLDRDTELASAPALESCAGPILLPLNGWFKRSVGSDPQWPPHEKIVPIFVGFHIRPHQCPELLEARSIEYLKAHEPIGCRDLFTMRALAERGVATYLSNCLSLTFPARPLQELGDKVIVASRNQEILKVLPPEYRRDCLYVNHYSVKDSFETYLREAGERLEFYRAHARLVITTFLHCALPCIAMGIPVVVFTPKPQDEFQKISDEQRFSGVTEITRVYRFEEASTVEWNPQPVESDGLRRRLALDFKNRVTAALAFTR